MNPTAIAYRSIAGCQSRIIAAFAMFLCAACALPEARGGSGPEIAYNRAHYAKTEYRIPMRDGIKLFTAVYAPKDAGQPWPILLERTPYGADPYGADKYPDDALGPSDLFSREGFIFVYQDVRGRGESEGVFDDPPAHKLRFSGPADADESTDSYDTIDWLVKHIPNNNGRVGTWGISYPGFFSAFSLINSHPALKAASPQAPMGDVGDGDDAYHNGAFFLAECFDFYLDFKPRPSATAPSAPREEDPSLDTPDEYEFFLRMGTLAGAEEKYFKHRNEYWTSMVAHDTYDQFWSSRALGPQMRHLTAPVLIVGGWFDTQDLGGTLKLFQAVAHDGGAPAATLVMGPWSHGGWSEGEGDTLGNLNFREKTARFYREQIEFPFFLQNLKGKGGGLSMGSGPTLPAAWIFNTGRDVWRMLDAWPPANAARRSLYLDAGGKLTFNPPDGDGSQFDEYVSDPAKPVPVTGEIGVDLSVDYMTHDQRFASRRPDVLVYQTEPLQKSVTIAGPVTPMLRVSTSGTDSDFVVKLIDVYPNDYRDPAPAAGGPRKPPGAVPMAGYQQLVRGEPFRGKFRNSKSQPEPFQPNQPAQIQFAMPDVMHTFLPGHRIMVQIQSSWFPLTDRNPQRFLDIPSAAPSDFQKAVERVYRGGPEGTRLDVLVTE
jgi:hypothetical protein